MKTPKFEQYKLKRFIAIQGLEYTFKRDAKDEFKEPIEAASEMTVKGVFHQTISHITLAGYDAASVPSKQQASYIMALYEDAKDIQTDDYVFIDGTKYLVNGINDINHWNVAVDISLEAVV